MKGRGAMAIPNLTGAGIEGAALGKRVATDSLEPVVKKQVPSQIIANIVRIRNFEDAARNEIWLSEKDLQKLFSNSSQSSDSLEQAPHYVQIANHVYEASAKEWLREGSIALNAAQIDQYMSTRDSFAQCSCKQNVLVKPFFPHLAKWPKLRALSIDITGLAAEKTVYLADMLSSVAQFCAHPQHIQPAQQLFLHHSQTAFRGSAFSLVSDSGPTDCGILTQDTEISFIGYSAKNLLQAVESQEIESIEFDVSFVACTDCNVHEVWKKGVNPLPLVEKETVLLEKFKEQYAGQELRVFQVLTLQYDEHWNLSVCLNALHLKGEPQNIYSNYTQVIKFDPSLSSSISASLSTHNLRLEPDHCQEAKFARFKVLDMEEKSAYLSKESLREALKDLKRPLFRGQQISIALEGVGQVLLQLKFARLEGGSLAKDAFAQIDEQTRMHFIVAGNLDLALVPDLEGKELSKVCIEVEREYSDNATDSYEENELVELLQEQLPSKFFEGQSFNLQTKDGHELTFNIAGMDFQETVEKSSGSKVLGFLNDKTKIDWKSEDISLKIIQDNALRIPSEKELYETFNIGGLSKQFASIIKSILLSRSHLKPELERRKIKPVKGLLLYGPPGNGKTALARKLGEILQCEERHVNLIVGSQIWNKWLGNSEANIRKLFDPAKDDEKAYGAKSPMHLLIIDEIDAMLPCRGDESSKSRDSVVNQFLSELDGLRPINNILVVGLTNNKDAMDPAVLRPGRFDVQLEIPLPNLEGRKEIFSIYSRDLKRENLLAEDVDLDSMIEKTEGFSGADIEALFEQAKLFGIDRLRKLPKGSDLSAHEDGLVYQKDFEQALNELLEFKGGLASKKPPPGLYT